ncbi:ankyrin repeat domain-containing protein 12 isoform X2 [Diorhabda carinulata]|uniref:ankyrin repeat domain-containing protein 12 isoform X2 n=1 Tax=Diorhabda carinulata TaxID=1163345 RepID=UPI0025A30BA1|nr:ankyrin repeat domain-containing protein 12 isoform X2 [Diorhabda carinulata]XP_057657517.1 ankyrin repeat domain-containing protein 12 isoform X2 [Diorhabda carinulata]
MPAPIRPKGSNSGSRTPSVTPMSERQQMALLMQMTSGNEPGSRSPSSSSSRSRERNERGWTPLHEACNHGWYDVAFRLVQSGANVNARGLDNDTPLHDAAVNGHLKLVKLLVERGADIYAKNSKGKTPLDVAPVSVKPYLLNSNLPLPDSTSGSRVVSRSSRDDKKITSSGEATPSTTTTSSGGNSVVGSTSNTASTSSKSQKDEQMDVKSSTASGTTVSTTGPSATTSTSTGEDVYEFKSSKEGDSSSDERKQNLSDNTEMEVDEVDPLGIAPPTTQASEETTTPAKRNFYDSNEGQEEAGSTTNTGDEETKRKKRKEENVKEGKSSNQRNTGQSKGQGNKQSTGGQIKSGSSSSSKVNSDKKSPCSSPKPSGSDPEAEDGKTDLKVPPLKIVIPQTTGSEQESGVGRNGKNSSQRLHQALPYVVPSSTNTEPTTEKETNSVANNPETPATTDKEEKKEDADDADEAQSNAETETSTATASAPAAPAPPPPVELHPRKRKMKQNKETAPPPSDSQENSTEAQVHPHEQPITNCYQLYLDIRKQIAKRRRGLFPVQPKPPQGFKDYLMNRCTYVLAGTAPTTPNVTYPQSLPQQMKDLFSDQEKERYRLRTQHVIEKEKLVLSVEQEILRVHGRAARALANQSLPFSVCTIIRDEEVYNLITPEQEEKDRNARSRYNGRLFLSWLQDVDDKWEKIKEHMLLRHHNEAESLHAVQKMDWEWKLKELNLCDRKTTPKIEETHVPMVHVSDDFDLLPA